jgi:LacI family transcriptional regulator
LSQTTLADVAKYAGVTSAAASYYFRGKKKLSREMGCKLDEAAAVLNYTPMYIRSMPEVDRNTHLVSMCFIIENRPAIDDIYYYYEMNGALEYLVDNDHQLIVNYLVEGDQQSNERFFSSLRLVRGVIINNPRKDHRVEDEIKKRNIPYVVLGTPEKTESPYYVDIDMQGAGFQAAEYLLEKGHRNILYLNLPESMLQSQQRRDGFILAHKQRGLDFNEADHIFAPVSADVCYRLVKEIFTASKAYTAVVTSNEIQAQGVLKAMKELNIKVPSKLALISMGGTMLGTFTTPQLTTIDFSPHTIGYEAARLLLDVLGKKRIRPFHLILPGNLVERDSTK